MGQGGYSRRKRALELIRVRYRLEAEDWRTRYWMLLHSPCDHAAAAGLRWHCCHGAGSNDATVHRLARDLHLRTEPEEVESVMSWRTAY